MLVPDQIHVDTLVKRCLHPVSGIIRKTIVFCLPEFKGVAASRVLVDLEKAPESYSRGNQAALIDRDGFLDLLKREGLEAIWVIAGEKSAYGGVQSHGGWGGSRAHTNLYRIKNGIFTVERFATTEEPSEAQLQEFFEG